MFTGFGVNGYWNFWIYLFILRDIKNTNTSPWLLLVRIDMKVIEFLSGVSSSRSHHQFYFLHTLQTFKSIFLQQFLLQSHSYNICICYRQIIYLFSTTHLTAIATYRSNTIIVYTKCNDKRKII